VFLGFKALNVVVDGILSRVTHWKKCLLLSLCHLKKLRGNCRMFTGALKDTVNVWYYNRDWYHCSVAFVSCASKIA
jgi:hypothetical protein